jgi:hypothetical protein
VRMPRCDQLSQRGQRGGRFDDPGAGPSHAPPAAAEVDFEDIRHRLEAVLQDVPEGIWSRIQDEGILEQCMGVPTIMAGHSTMSSSGWCGDDWTTAARAGGTGRGWTTTA